MRKKISYDKKYLSDVLNYSQVPVRQILALDLKPFQQIILIHLFSHSTDWGISYNQISKSFFKTKNRNDIKKCFEALVEKGYLKESNNTYHIMLAKIQSDYIKFSNKADSKPKNDSSANIDNKPNNQPDSSANNDLIVPLSGGDSNINSPIDSSTTNNNINKTDIKEKEKIRTLSNKSIELDLECDSLQSQASPSVLAPSLHTPKEEVEKVNKQSSLPVNEVDKVTKELSSPIVDELSQSKDNLEPIPVEPDKRFFEQLKEYNTSIYFLPKNLDKVKNLYIDYSKECPNKFMKIKDFEKVLICLMVGTFEMVKLKGINFCILYYPNDIRHNFKYIPQVRKDMLDYPEDTIELLKKFKLPESELKK